MDVRALLHNKWALGGVAVAAAAGGVVYLRKKSTGGSSSSSTGAQASPAYAGGVGGFDSTGTDVAAQLGQYQANTQVQLDQYQKQLSDALAGLAQVPAGTTGTGTGPATAAAGAPGPKYVSIGTGSNEYDFANANVPGAKTAGEALLTLEALNPQLKGWTKWNNGAPIFSNPKGAPLRVS